MAKIYDNIIIEGLRGSLGKRIVFKRDKAGRTIMSLKPVFSEDRVFNPAQQAHHKAFKEAASYAKDAKDHAVYIEKAAGTPMNPYNVAVADWFVGPEVLEIDGSRWSGEVGQVIRVKAQDNVMVARVKVSIQDAQGNSVEDGEAVRTGANSDWWEYTTQTQVTLEPAMHVIASAFDLPGNSYQLNWQNN